MSETIQFPGFKPPTQNYCKVPLSFFENIHLIKSIAEMKVVLYILRHTWGFQEFDISKTITTDEFVNGRKRKDGSRLDQGTGLSAPSVRSGLKSAVTNGFIKVETDASDKARIEKSYKLAMEQPADEEKDLPSDSKKVSPDGKTFTIGGKESLHRSEKDTIERNSKKEKDSVADATVSKNPDTKPVKEPTPVEDTDPSKERNKGVNAIIKAWVDQTRYLGPPDKPYKNKTHRDHAGALYDAGVTPYEVQAFISECQGDKYKPDAPRFIWVCENIGAWRARQGSPAQTVQAFIESDDEDAYVHEPITSPLIQSLVQQVIKGTEAALKGETIEDKSA